MLIPLKPLVDEAVSKPYAVPAFNVCGYEDAAAIVAAAESMKAAVILVTNKVAVGHMPIECLGWPHAPASGPHGVGTGYASI